MTTKLTLTIEDKVIISAKRYAEKKGKSLSHLVENYLKSIGSTEHSPNISARVSKMMGIIKLANDVDYKTELSNALSKKYKK